jgi:hypothetical protein
MIYCRKYRIGLKRLKPEIRNEILSEAESNE